MLCGFDAGSCTELFKGPQLFKASSKCVALDELTQSGFRGYAVCQCYRFDGDRLTGHFWGWVGNIANNCPAELNA